MASFCPGFCSLAFTYSPHRIWWKMNQAPLFPSKLYKKVGRHRGTIQSVFFSFLQETDGAEGRSREEQPPIGQTDSYESETQHRYKKMGRGSISLWDMRNGISSLYIASFLFLLFNFFSSLTVVFECSNVPNSWLIAGIRQWKRQTKPLVSESSALRERRRTRSVDFEEVTLEYLTF